MARIADFEADIADLCGQVAKFVERLGEAALNMDASADDAPDSAGVIAELLSDVPVATEKAARLILAFEESAAVVADDFSSMDRFRGRENLAGLFSEGIRQKMRTTRVRRLALPARLDALLSCGGAVCRLLDEARSAMRSARGACECLLERLTRRAIAASTDLEVAERQLGALETDISHIERRLGPATGSDAVVKLAEDHARLAGDRRAMLAQVASLRRARADAEGIIVVIEPLFAGLSTEIAALDTVRTRLATGLEADVLLHSAVWERIRNDRIGGIDAAWSNRHAGIVAELIALRAKGALSVRDIERRKTAADAAFAELFPDVAGRPAEAPDNRRYWPMLRRPALKENGAA